MRPRGPVPLIVERSTPSAAATRAATGETWAPAGTDGAGVATGGAASAAAAGAPAPSAMRAMTWPTLTVSPSSKRISVIVPLAGAGSSMSTLSVESSTTVWPFSTGSPTLTAHSRIVPSVTDSPPVGVTMSMISASAGASGAAAGAAGAAPLVPISASSWPTCTVSPSGAWILTRTPAAGAGTSASTLSVEISTRTSSASTGSPSCLCHSRIVPSVTDSPMAGLGDRGGGAAAIATLSPSAQPPPREGLHGRLRRRRVIPPRGPGRRYLMFGLSRRARLASALVVALAIAALPSAAFAAKTVSGDPSSGLTYSDGDNTADNLTVSQSGSTVTFHDPSATPVANAGPNCTQDTANHDVTCTSVSPNIHITIDLGGGDDQTTFANVVESVTEVGGSGNDTLQAVSGFLAGDAGNDTLQDVGAGGAVTMEGDAGTDVYSAKDGDTVSYGDRLTPVTVTQDGVANDGEVGENENVPGNVQLRGGAGDDSLTAGVAAVTLNGGSGNDTLTGGAGNDRLTGSNGNDTLNGGPGDDNLSGDDGNDTLNGQDGDDFLFGSWGSDALSGGAGTDRADYFGFVGPGGVPLDQSVTEDGVADDGAPGENDNVALDVEEIDTGNGNDTIVGGAGVNKLVGFAHNDTIDGGAGSDVLDGQTGDDTLRARDGVPDQVTCGPGTDTAQFDQLDTVAGDCERVGGKQAAGPPPTAGPLQTPSPLQDRPPTVTLTAPSAGAALPANTPTSLTANASDDLG